MPAFSASLQARVSASRPKTRAGFVPTGTNKGSAVFGSLTIARLPKGTKDGRKVAS
jgi:hypothetical protein